MRAILVRVAAFCGAAEAACAALAALHGPLPGLSSAAYLVSAALWVTIAAGLAGWY